LPSKCKTVPGTALCPDCPRENLRQTRSAILEKMCPQQTDRQTDK